MTDYLKNRKPPVDIGGKFFCFRGAPILVQQIFDKKDSYDRYTGRNY